MKILIIINTPIDRTIFESELLFSRANIEYMATPIAIIRVSTVIYTKVMKYLSYKALNETISVI